MYFLKRKFYTETKMKCRTNAEPLARCQSEKGVHTTHLLPNQKLIR